MARVWTPEAREAQAAVCRKHQCWKHSTGPRTVEGKAIVAMNSYKGEPRKVERELDKAINAMIRTWSLERYGKTRPPKF